jgi:excisionase family DNA binding protein
MKVDEVAALLRVSTTTIYRECQKGTIPYFKIAGSLRFDRSDITEWLAARKVKPVIHNFR